MQMESSPRVPLTDIEGCSNEKTPYNKQDYGKSLRYRDLPILPLDVVGSEWKFSFVHNWGHEFSGITCIEFLDMKMQVIKLGWSRWEKGAAGTVLCGCDECVAAHGQNGCTFQKSSCYGAKVASSHDKGLKQLGGKEFLLRAFLCDTLPLCTKVNSTPLHNMCCNRCRNLHGMFWETKSAGLLVKFKVSDPAISPLDRDL
eukprot:Filipodium_phascolosomae@DN2250_c0_g1_i2.p1